MEPLLSTKLFIPTIRSELVLRYRLIEQLNACSKCTLTLISAPAGFGKTSLVCEWLKQLQTNHDQYMVAWLSLDERDTSLARFLTYIIAALNHDKNSGVTLGGDAMDMLQSPQPPSHESVLTSLINEISSSTNQYILILDDYHLVNSSQIEEALCFLLENIPPQLHLVISTREDPFLPIARLRARGQLNELRAADLRFTLLETAEFLNHAMGLSLSNEDIAALEARTEGWIAGLHLAAISMQNLADVGSFISSFTGSHRLVFDYLIEEVLNQQPSDIQDFLLRTAILNRMNASLCNTLTGETNSQSILEKLDHANMFIIPLDNERHWFRYHHLFAELLKQRLGRKHRTLVIELNRKAAKWLEEAGEISEAIHHAFAGDDLEMAVRLVEKGALAALERSRFGFIFDAVDRLPETALENAPWLYIYHAWALILAGQVEPTKNALEKTDWLLECVSDKEKDRKRMLGYIAGLQASLSSWNRNLQNTIYFTQQAKENLPQNHWILGYCYMMLGAAYWSDGNLKAAEKVFLEADAIGKANGNKRVAVTSVMYLVHTMELQGRFHQAVGLINESFQYVKQDGVEIPLVGYIKFVMAKVLYELNELESSRKHLVEGIHQCQLLSDKRLENLCYCLLTRIHLANGDLPNAAMAVQKANEFDRSPEIIYDMRGLEYPEVLLWLHQDDFDAIKLWLDKKEKESTENKYFKSKLTRTMLARAMIALGRVKPGNTFQFNQSLEILNEVLSMIDGKGWIKKGVEVQVLKALAYDAKGDDTQALTELGKALELAEPHDFVRTFVDEGKPLARLLHASLSRDKDNAYIAKLLNAFPVLESETNIASNADSSDSELIEPLSDREIEIIQLIADGLTNQEIGNKLFLSLNTVKAHSRNIYGKLGVNSRTQAVARARALGLLLAA